MCRAGERVLCVFVCRITLDEAVGQLFHRGRAMESSSLRSWPVRFLSAPRAIIESTETS